MASASLPTAIQIAADPQALAQLYAQWLAEKIAVAKAPFRMALCGGSSPRPLYSLLASESWRDRIDWTKLELFWGDERFVPHDDPDSNVHMARMLWLDHVPLATKQIHPMPTDGAIADCAARYEAQLKSHYGRDRLDPGLPLFDVVLLGVGSNGHTASLMPTDPVLDEHARWVAPMLTPMPQPRLTLTYPAIAASRFVTFMAAGTEKRDVVAHVRQGDDSLPATRIASEGAVIWFLDQAAAGTPQPKP